MRKLLFITVCLIGSLFMNAQAPDFLWAKKAGSTSEDGGHSIAIDNSGNIYTVGYFQNTVDFDPGPGVFNLTAAYFDVFISKSDNSGNFIWAKQISGSMHEIAWDVAIDASGNLCVGGYFSGTVDFDPGPASYTLASAGSDDAFIFKLDNSGNFIWAKSFSGALGDELVKALTFDSFGNVIAIGSFQATVDFDPGPGIINLNSFGDHDVFIVKLNASGNLMWAKNIGGTMFDQGYDVVTDASDNVYSIGYFAGTGDFDPNAATFNLSSSGGSDVFISKLSASGNFIWAKSLGGASQDNGWSMTLDAAGDICFTGGFQGMVDFDPGPGIFNLAASGNQDVFISKLNANGNFVWAKNIGGTLSLASNCIYTDALNNIYVTGGYYGTVDFDPGIGTFNLNSAGSSDIFISKLDLNGNFAWATSMGGTSVDNSFSIKVDASGNIYTTGVFIGTSDFNPGAGVYNLASAGPFYDIFLNKLGPCYAPVAPVNVTPAFNQNICANTSASLSVSGAGNIYWFAGPASTLVLATGSVYTTPVLSQGTYTFYAEDSTCTNSVSRTAITLTVNICTEISSGYLKDNNIKVYPNPTAEFINIELEDHDEVKVEIVNTLGQTVFEETIRSENVKLDLKKLDTGIYFLKTISNDKIIATKKIIKS